MALNLCERIDITNAGLTQTYTASTLPDVVYLVLDSNLTLAADVNISTITTQPAAGVSVIYYINGTPNVDLNGHNFYIEGSTIDESSIRGGCYVYLVSDGSDWSIPFICPSFDPSLPGYDTLDGKYLVDGTVELAKLEALSRGYIVRGNSSNVPVAYNAKTSGYILIGDGTDLNSVAQSGDVVISTAGVSAIQAGVIVDADINAAAAITRTKVANGTASHVVINSGAGALSSEATLATTRGGTAQDTSASTGFPKVSSGTWSVAAITDVLVMDVSFEAAGGTVASVGDFKVVMPFACTVTGLYAYATKAIAGTDNGTIVPKNNASTTMTSGTITFTASDARGTAYTSTPSANNTFIAGDILTLTTAKTTAGGWAKVSITYTRTA